MVFEAEAFNRVSQSPEVQIRSSTPSCWWLEAKLNEDVGEEGILGISIESESMRLKSTLALVVTTLLWGSSFIMLKVLLGEVPPVAIAFLRFLIAAPFLLGIALWKGRGKKRPPGSWKSFIVLGFLGVALYNVLQNLGLNLIMTSESSLLVCTDPIFIAVLGYYFLGERLGAAKVTGILIAFLGVAVIVLRGGPGFASSWQGFLGDVLSLGGAVTWAVYSVYGKKRLASNSAYDVAAFSAVFGAIFLLQLMAVVEGVALPVTAAGWILLILLGLLPSGVAYLLWYVAMEDISAYKAGLSLFFIPLVSMVLAALLLGDQLDLLFRVGASLVLGGVLVTTLSK